MSSYNLYGGDALIGINRAFSNPESDLSFPMSDLINLWTYGLETWSTPQSVNIGDLAMTAAEADPLATLKGLGKFQMKWKSDEGSSLVIASSSTKDSAVSSTLHNYQKNMAITFKSSSSDQLTWIGNEKNWWATSEKNSTSKYNFKESGSINYSYLGDLLDKFDDVKIKFTYNNFGTETNDQSGARVQLDKTTVISESISSTSMKLSVNATVRKLIDSNSNTETVKLSNYNFQDNDTGFSLSCNGAITKNTNDKYDIDLRNITVTTSDYKLTSAILQDKQINFDYDMLPDNNYQQISSTYSDLFEAELLKASNVIKVTNANGALVGGGDGADKITGNIGDDIIHGGKGKDVMTGGAGDDIFAFANDDGIDAKDKDLITDFTRGSDLIGLKGSLFNKFDGKQVEASNIVYGKAADMQKLIASSSTVLFFNQDNKTLYYDGDGSVSTLKPIEIVTLTGVSALDASDFFVF